MNHANCAFLSITGHIMYVVNKQRKLDRLKFIMTVHYFRELHDCDFEVTWCALDAYCNYNC